MGRIDVTLIDRVLRAREPHSKALIDEMDEQFKLLTNLAATVVDPFEPWTNRNAEALDAISSKSDRSTALNGRSFFARTDKALTTADLMLGELLCAALWNISSLLGWSASMFPSRRAGQPPDRGASGAAFMISSASPDAKGGAVSARLAKRSPGKAC